MNKNSYYVIESQNTETGKYYSRAEKIPNCYNLIGKFTAPAGFIVISVNACSTWNEAQEIANFWNDGARKRGKLAF